MISINDILYKYLISGLFHLNSILTGTGGKGTSLVLKPV